MHAVDIFIDGVMIAGLDTYRAPMWGWRTWAECYNRKRLLKMGGRGPMTSACGAFSD